MNKLFNFLLPKLEIHLPDSWFGYPFKVHWSATILLLAIACLSIPFAAFGLVLFLSIVVHELAHAVVAKRLGYSVMGITIHFMGGGTFIKEFLNKEGINPSEEIKICIAGPISNILLGFFTFAYLIPANSSFSFYLINCLGFFGFLNLFLAVYNLLPVWPLDGGRILHAFANQILGDNNKAMNVCVIASVLFSGSMIGLGIWLSALGWIIIGFLCILFTLTAYSAFSSLDEEAIGELDNV